MSRMGGAVACILAKAAQAIVVTQSSAGVCPGRLNAWPWMDERIGRELTNG
jgi:hypothetical protein